MATDKNIKVEIDGLTDETANKMAEQLSEMARATPFDTKIIYDMVDLAVLQTYNEISLKTGHYFLKTVTSSFLTRWYWRRKYNQSNKKLECFTLSNTPTPDVMFDNINNRDHETEEN